MILQALTAYYSMLAERGAIAKPGWSKAKVSWALQIDGNGKLLQVHPLKTEVQAGKKNIMMPRELELPAAVKRTVGIAPNFLWDNAAYLLGIDSKGKPERALECFAAAKALHTTLLAELDDPFAQAICAFFAQWDPSQAREEPLLSECMAGILAGENLTFLMGQTFCCDNDALRTAWQRHYDGEGEGMRLRCLVTGKLAEPAAVHPSIMKVAGAQSSGAALVSFNAPAFCSYNKEQSYNAPVSKEAAFAYTAALNYLLSERKEDGRLRFASRVGDMTVVYWAEDAQPAYQDAISAILGGAEENTITNRKLSEIMEDVAAGKPQIWENIPLSPENPFYILGIAPNAARLSVRLFLRSSFGDIIRHLKSHYDRLRIVKPIYDKWEDIPLWVLLNETVNKNARDKTPQPQMAGDVLRAMLTDGRYPATLYQQTMLRIRAEKEITRGRAAIIKAYLIRNTDNPIYKEALQMKLNEQTTYPPYVLGRLFSVLESIQQKANPGINATIRDKYFNSASATPSVIFPILLNLAPKHMKKLEGGIQVYYAKQLGALMEAITESFPKHLTLEEQGIFQLGYYHQKQKRFETKNTEEMIEEVEENV